MSIPRNHHFLPEFYLKRWTTASDPRVWAYRRFGNKLDARQLFPGGVGYHRDLYAIESREDNAAKQEVETGFMTPLDTQASKALQYLEEFCVRPPDPSLQNGWTRFVMSLLYRHPRQVSRIREQVRENHEEIWDELERRYTELRGRDDPRTFREYREAAGPSYTAEREAALLKSLIDHTGISGHLAAMNWSLIEFRVPKHGLLTGDDPVMVSNGVGQRDGFIAVPVGPKTIFLAVVDPETRKGFVDQGTKLERAFNDAIVHQAESLVVAQTDAQRAFIDNRLGRTPRSTEQGWSKTMHRHTWKSPVIFPDVGSLTPIVTF